MLEVEGFFDRRSRFLFRIQRIAEWIYGRDDLVGSFFFLGYFSATEFPIRIVFYDVSVRPSVDSLFFFLFRLYRLVFFFVSLESFFLFYCFSFGRTDRRARINIFWVSSVCFLFAPVPRGVSLIRFLQQFSSTIVVSCFTIGRNKSLINGTNVSKKNSHVFVSAVLSVKEANVRPFGFRNVSVMKHWNVVLLRPHKVGLRSPFHLDSIT